MSFDIVYTTVHNIVLKKWNDLSSNGNGIYIPHFLYVYNQMRFTFNHPTHES